MTNATRQKRHDAETADEEAERTNDHLEDVDDGCGCAEVWEHLSENREAAADD